MSEITLDWLLDAVDGDVVAIRSRLRLQPAGGRGDKVFPPTYGGNGSNNRYAYEERAADDGDKKSITVLLDSVASQANRAELALLDAYRSGKVRFPVPYIDFSDVKDLILDYDKLTVLDAPHRIADAIFRDSELKGKSFRNSEIGRDITDATPRNATALYRYSPSALLFGMWDSTGPKGGLGSKFQRAYVSEIVGHDAHFGVKVGSRLDPIQIGLLPNDQLLYNHKDKSEVWTPFEEDAERDAKGKPVFASRGSGEGKPGQPSKVNHGNIVPSRDDEAGGVTISFAEQTSVLSLATIRKLRFDGYDQKQTVAARSTLVALGLVAMQCVWCSDYDLRSRCLLIPEEKPNVQVLRRDGSSDSHALSFSDNLAMTLLQEAAQNAKECGLGWFEEEIKLTPASKLIELMRRSQAIKKTDSIDNG